MRNAYLNLFLQSFFPFCDKTQKSPTLPTFQSFHVRTCDQQTLFSMKSKANYKMEKNQQQQIAHATEHSISVCW